MNVAIHPAAHAAPGPYLGFSLQPVRLCYHLLTAPQGSYVSLEHLDDIAVHCPDGSVILEQCKSATKQNPISDRAVDFWKTISHWVNECKAERIEPNRTKFRLYVVPTRTGKLATAMNKASCAADVREIDREIRKIAEKLPESADYLPFIKNYLSADFGTRVSVVTRMTIESQHQDPVAPIIALIEATITSSFAEMIARSAIGMAKEQADKLIRFGKTGIVDRDEFRKSFHIFVQRVNTPGILTSMSPKPSSEAVNTLMAIRPTFVRQLEIINAELKVSFRAVSDFLQTSADKTKWADVGLLYPDSLNEWDENLIMHHSAICGEISDLHGALPAIARGRLAYNRCSRIEAALDSRAVPGHFVHGCLNALADDRRIGWHPDYIAILEGI